MPIRQIQTGLSTSTQALFDSKVSGKKLNLAAEVKNHKARVAELKSLAPQIEAFTKGDKVPSREEMNNFFQMCVHYDELVQADEAVRLKLVKAKSLPANSTTQHAIKELSAAIDEVVIDRKLDGKKGLEIAEVGLSYTPFEKYHRFSFNKLNPHDTTQAVPPKQALIEIGLWDLKAIASDAAEHKVKKFEVFSPNTWNQLIKLQQFESSEVFKALPVESQKIFRMYDPRPHFFPDEKFELNEKYVDKYIEAFSDPRFLNLDPQIDLLGGSRPLRYIQLLSSSLEPNGSAEAAEAYLNIGGRNDTGTFYSYLDANNLQGEARTKLVDLFVRDELFANTIDRVLGNFIRTGLAVDDSGLKQTKFYIDTLQKVAANPLYAGGNTTEKNKIMDATVSLIANEEFQAHVAGGDTQWCDYAVQALALDGGPLGLGTRNEFALEGDGNYEAIQKNVANAIAYANGRTADGFSFI